MFWNSIRREITTNTIHIPPYRYTCIHVLYFLISVYFVIEKPTSLKICDNNTINVFLYILYILYTWLRVFRHYTCADRGICTIMGNGKVENWIHSEMLQIFFFHMKFVYFLMYTIYMYNCIRIAYTITHIYHLTYVMSKVYF